MTQEAAPGSGSNRLIRARWFGRPTLRLPSKTFTTLTVNCMPDRQAGIVREKPLPTTDSSDREGDCTSPASSPRKPSSSPSRSFRGSRYFTTSSSLRVITCLTPFLTSKAALTACFSASFIWHSLSLNYLPAAPEQLSFKTSALRLPCRIENHDFLKTTGLPWPSRQCGVVRQ